MIDKRIKIEILSRVHFKRVFNYYSLNKKHLEPWGSKRTDDYYTLQYHIDRCKNRVELMNKKESMHFILLYKLKSIIIGVCNYTHINNIECRLGYSVAEHYQGSGIMYQTLLKTNIYMFNNYNINQIISGIMPKNKRSIRLIKRLNFQSTGNFRELAVNGKKENIEIFSLLRK